MNSSHNNIKLSTAPNKQEVSIPSPCPFSLSRGVKECKNALLKERLRTLIRNKGLTERQFYHSLNLTRQYWYGISWGILIIPFEMKLKIAKALDTDTSLIFQSIKTNESSSDEEEPPILPKSEVTHLYLSSDLGRNKINESDNDGE